MCVCVYVCVSVCLCVCVYVCVWTVDEDSPISTLFMGCVFGLGLIIVTGIKNKNCCSHNISSALVKIY